jgi:Fe-S-cluster containining protein
MWKWIAVAAIVPLLFSAYGISLRYKTFRYCFLRLIYLFLQPVVMISFILSKIEQYVKPPAWPISGACLKCGQCCKLLAMHVPSFVAQREYLRNMVKWYYEENFGMIYEALDDEVWMVFSCPNLKNNLCSIYNRRPRICRQYPFENSFLKPDIASYCGFSHSRNEK